MDELLLGVTSDGLAVAEGELAGDDPSEAVAAARASGADVLWLHAEADLSRFGFGRRHGYVRLAADALPAGEALPLLAGDDYATVLDAAYRGLWGHKHVASDASPPEGSIAVGLFESDAPIGLCRVFPSERLVDGPGVVAGHRAPAAYASLLLGGCAQLAAGPVVVDSWGDAPEVIAAYVQLGLEIVEQVPGWELPLRTGEVPSGRL